MAFLARGRDLKGGRQQFVMVRCPRSSSVVGQDTCPAVGLAFAVKPGARRQY